MYNENVMIVRINDKFTSGFRLCVGVRQGDNCSLNLFKIYVNDLPIIVDKTC